MTAASPALRQEKAASIPCSRNYGRVVDNGHLVKIRMAVATA